MLIVDAFNRHFVDGGGHQDGHGGGGYGYSDGHTGGFGIGYCSGNGDGDGYGNVGKCPEEWRAE